MHAEFPVAAFDLFQADGVVVIFGIIRIYRADDFIGEIEPLCALYRPAALAELAAGVARGIAAPHRLAEAAGLRVRYLEGESLRRFGAPEDLFLNLNTPLDVERWMVAISG